jgi:DNA-directed RNA polymerase subunit M
VEPRVAKVIQHRPQQLVAVIGKEEQKLRTLPTLRIECPKCGNNLAYVWQVQTSVRSCGEFRYDVTIIS